MSEKNARNHGWGCRFIRLKLPGGIPLELIEVWSGPSLGERRVW